MDLAARFADRNGELERSCELFCRSLPISTTPEVFWLHNNASLTAALSSATPSTLSINSRGGTGRLLRSQAIDEGLYIARPCWASGLGYIEH